MVRLARRNPRTINPEPPKTPAPARRGLVTGTLRRHFLAPNWPARVAGSITPAYMRLEPALPILIGRRRIHVL